PRPRETPVTRQGLERRGETSLWASDCAVEPVGRRSSGGVAVPGRPGAQPLRLVHRRPSPGRGTGSLGRVSPDRNPVASARHRVAARGRVLHLVGRFIPQSRPRLTQAGPLPRSRAALPAGRGVVPESLGGRGQLPERSSGPGEHAHAAGPGSGPGSAARRGRAVLTPSAGTVRETRPRFSPCPALPGKIRPRPP